MNVLTSCRPLLYLRLSEFCLGCTKQLHCRVYGANSNTIVNVNTPESKSSSPSSQVTSMNQICGPLAIPSGSLPGDILNFGGVPIVLCYDPMEPYMHVIPGFIKSLGGHPWIQQIELLGYTVQLHDLVKCILSSDISAELLVTIQDHPRVDAPFQLRMLQALPQTSGSLLYRASYLGGTPGADLWVWIRTVPNSTITMQSNIMGPGDAMRNKNKDSLNNSSITDNKNDATTSPLYILEPC